MVLQNRFLTKCISEFSKFYEMIFLGVVKGPYRQGPYRHDPPRFIFNHRKPATTHGKTCTDMIPPIFDRIDLRINLSKAKFDEEADFKANSAVAFQKTHQISKKRNFQFGNFSEKNFSVEKRNVHNRLKRVLAKFRTDPSHVRVVTKNFHPITGRNELLLRPQIHCELL